MRRYLVAVAEWLPDAIGAILFGFYTLVVLASGAAVAVVAIRAGDWYYAPGGLVLIGLAAIPVVVGLEERGY